jgi:putative zinc finger/helix-turn-helix YgiT family protein
MSEKRICFSCEQERDVALVERKETVTIKGKDVEFVAVAYRCSVCGDEFETPEQLDSNLEAAREAYARLYETLTPESLVALRASYNASQKAFGLLLGFGELTMNSYEKGSAPTSTNRLLLNLASDPYCFRKMYELNKTRIGETQRKRIEASSGFLSAQHWERMDAVYHNLTADERGSVERRSRDSGLPVSRIVATCVTETLTQDYARLLYGARWSSLESKSIHPETNTQELAV